MFESIISVDQYISQSVLALYGPVLNKVMIAVTTIANPIPLTIITTILVLFLVYKRKWFYSLLVVISMLSGLFAETLIKLIVQRARPISSLIEMSDFSFPSGHATMSTIFFLLIVYIWKDKIKNRFLRGLFIISNVLCFLTIGFSRVYLNAHWMSDVLTGFILGGAVFLLVPTLMSRRKKLRL